MQFPENHRQNVVASVDQRAEKVLPLLDHPQQASDFGRAGAELVRKHLLPPRLIRDKLQLLWVLLHA